MSTAEQGIRAAVGRAWWRFHAARLAECACLGLAAGLLTLAAAVASGAAPLTAQALAVAALSALACGAAWWHEQRRTPAQVAQRLDASLARAGALATAFECAGREERGAFEDLLLEREARELAPAASRRAIAPPSVAFVAGPLVAAAVLSLALERAPLPATAARGSLAGAGQGVAASAEGQPGAEAEPGAAEPGLPGSGVPASGIEPEVDLAGVLPHNPPVDGSGAAGEDAGAGASAVVAESLLGGADRTDAGAPRAADMAGSSGSALAQTDAGRTMAGSATAAGPDMTPPDNSLARNGAGPEPGAAGPGVVEPGIVSGRWWPAHYDSIVRDWTAVRAEEQP